MVFVQHHTDGYLKSSHEVALKQFGLYLKKHGHNLGRELIMKPDGKLNVEYYVDDDFYGIWG